MAPLQKLNYALSNSSAENEFEVPLSKSFLSLLLKVLLFRIRDDIKQFEPRTLCSVTSKKTAKSWYMPSLRRILAYWLPRDLTRKQKFLGVCLFCIEKESRKFSIVEGTDYIKILKTCCTTSPFYDHRCVIER